MLNERLKEIIYFSYYKIKLNKMNILIDLYYVPTYMYVVNNYVDLLRRKSFTLTDFNDV